MYHVYVNTKNGETITAPASMVILKENHQKKEFLVEVSGKLYEVDEDEFEVIFQEISSFESNFKESVRLFKESFSPNSIIHLKVCTL